MVFILNLSENFFNVLHFIFYISDPVEKTYYILKTFLNLKINFYKDPYRLIRLKIFIIYYCK